MLDEELAATGRLILVGDFGSFPVGWRAAFAAIQLEIIEEVSTLQDVLMFLRFANRKADLILCDEAAINYRDVIALKNVTKDFPEIAIVILAENVNATSIATAMECGARGFLHTNMSARALSLTLQLILLGENLFARPAVVALEGPMNDKCLAFEDPSNTKGKSAEHKDTPPRRVSRFRRGKPTAPK